MWIQLGHFFVKGKKRMFITSYFVQHLMMFQKSSKLDHRENKSEAEVLCLLFLSTCHLGKVGKYCERVDEKQRVCLHFFKGCCYCYYYYYMYNEQWMNWYIRQPRHLFSFWNWFFLLTVLLVWLPKFLFWQNIHFHHMNKRVRH